MTTVAVIVGMAFLYLVSSYFECENDGQEAVSFIKAFSVTFPISILGFSLLHKYNIGIFHGEILSIKTILYVLGFSMVISVLSGLKSAFPWVN